MLVQGNIIGLNAAGTAAVANSVGGIQINNAANNVIGGTTATARNLISGNVVGVLITGNSATGNYLDGLELAKSTVESNFRVKIDFVIAIDFQTFIDVVDDLGGVQLDIPPELDGYNLSAPYTGHNIRLRAGRQVGTGEYALAFSRARKTSEGDLGRLKRASQTLAAIFDKARSLPAGQAAAIFLKYLPNIETTLDPADWPRLMQLASGVDRDSIQFYSVGDFVTPFVTEDGADVLQPNFGAIDAMLDEAFPGARTG